MGLGINMGNALETPFEGVFAHAASAQHFEMFHDAGFGNCRIPVCWGNHMLLEEPWTIKPAFLRRVQELVDASLSHGLVTTITAHHEWWIDTEANTQQKQSDWMYQALPRFESMWKQIATHFRHHRQLLLFSILNEPCFLSVASLNELHRVALIAIRETNPTRVVMFSGLDFANPRWLLDNPKAILIPRDPQLMLEIHMTEPHGFAGASPSQEAWGTVADRERVTDWVSRIELFGRARNLPIYVGEFGCSNEQALDKGRKAWLEANWKEMRRKSFAASLWDDGDRFKIYDRKSGEWDHDVLSTLQRSLPGLQGMSVYRTGGGLGGDSSDPCIDLQRTLELAFSNLGRAVDDVEKLPELQAHDFKPGLGRLADNAESEGESDYDSD